MCGYAPCRRARQRRLEESRYRKANDLYSWIRVSLPVRFSIHAVQPRAVIPENLFPGATRDVHPHEMIDGVRPMGIGVGIVRRYHDVVVADSFDDIRYQFLLYVYGNETLAQEIIAWLSAQGLIGVSFA